MGYGPGSTGASAGMSPRPATPKPMPIPTAMGAGNMGSMSIAGSPANFGAMMGKMAANSLGR